MIDPFIVGLVAFTAMTVLLVVGVPVGVALGTVGFAGLWLRGGWSTALGFIQTVPYALVADYAFAVMPMFILMGNLAVTAGLPEEVYDASYKWLGRMKGGFYLTTIAGQALMGGISGSTVVDSTVFTRTALPQMLRYGYPRSYSAACIAATGSFAAMIPPSITMVIYGIITETSIGKILIAGILPGVLAAVVYALAVIAAVRVRPEVAGPVSLDKVPLRERFRSLKGLWAAIFLFVLVLGGLYLGIFPPSGAGAAGAFGTLLIVVVRRKLTLRTLWQALWTSSTITATIFSIIIGGLIFSRFLVWAGAVDAFAKAILVMTSSPAGVLSLVVLMYLVLGCLIDTTSMMIVTLPFVFPITQKLGFDPIWFGILVVKLVEIATITPPVGLNLFAVASAAEGTVTLDDLIRGIWPFVILEILILIILIAFPQISLWLPNRMS